MWRKVRPGDRTQPSGALRQLLEELRGSVDLDFSTTYPIGAPDCWIVSTGSSVDVAILPESFTGREVVVKFTTFEPARSELEASTENVRALSAEPRLREWAHYLPTIIAAGRSGPTAYVIEECLSGRDGGSMGAETSLVNSVMSGSLSVIAELHRVTSSSQVVDERLLKALVDDPVATIRESVSAGPRHWRYLAFDLLTIQLREALSEGPVRLGWVHGDFHLGNVMFDEDGGQVVGIIDWGRSSPEGLTSLDPFTLLITNRALGSHQELGAYIVTLLEEWAGATNDASCRQDLSDLQTYVDAQGGLGMRETLLMMWLHHVSNNLKFEQRARLHFLWNWENVDVILDRLWEI